MSNGLIKFLCRRHPRFLRCRPVTHFHYCVRVLKPAPLQGGFMSDTVYRVLASPGQEVARINLQPTRDDGSPGTLDGPATWTLDNDFFRLDLTNEGRTASVILVSPLPGVSTFTASGDGDLGSGVSTITQSFTFENVALKTSHMNGTVEVLLPAPPAGSTDNQAPVA
jgi:hypothetical protein